MNLKEYLYSIAGNRLEAWWARVGFAMEQRPRINPDRQSVAYPSPFKACVLISADFELAWAWRYAKCGVSTPQTDALRRANQARQNLPHLMILFDRFNVPITWATVGHLFLENCVKDAHCAHADVCRIPYFENEFWRYGEGDWFDADPCTDYYRNPAWYAPDIIHAILNAEVKHEIACHSFSHIDFSDGVCPPEVANSELQKCQEVARGWGLKLESFVFPGNLIGNLTSLKRHGFNAYRWHKGYELDVPRRDGLGLWQIPGGLCWEKPEGWSVDAWIRALQRCVDRALETGTVLHLWLHPSCEPSNVETVFPAVLDYVAAHRSDLWVTTMAGLVDWLTATGE